MWSNAGLSTSILITTRSPANGMVHHTVARIFVSTKLRDLGPKSSATRTFWRMVATCIRYQPPTQHLLWDLTTFSLASVKLPFVGTGFLGLAHPFSPSNSSDDTPEIPQIPSICLIDPIPATGSKDALRLAMVTPLPPMGILERVLLSLKDGQMLSESTVRRLRRKESDMRAAAAEGTSLKEYRKKKQKKLATRTSMAQAACELSSEKELSTQGLNSATTTAYLPSLSESLDRKTMMQADNPFDGEQCKSNGVEDVAGLAASVSVHQSPDTHGGQFLLPKSHV